MTDPLDNAPWAALASLGLFKLFNDWQSRGFSLPMMAQPAPPPVSNNPGTPSPCKKRKEEKPGMGEYFAVIMVKNEGSELKIGLKPPSFLPYLWQAIHSRIQDSSLALL